VVLSFIPSIIRVFAVFGAVIALASCEQIEATFPDEAAEAYLRDNSKTPFETINKETAYDNGLTAKVILWANISKEGKTDECETIVTLDKYGNRWKGKSATPFRSVNSPPTALLSNIEVVEIGDQSVSFGLCAGKNINPSATTTVRERSQLCLNYSTRMPETLRVKLLKDGKEETTSFFALEKQDSGYSGWARILKLTKGEYKIEFHQYSKITKTYTFNYEPTKN
jgi:hypothetical protein